MKIGFITDIHEDISDLLIALELLKEEGCEKIICLGDIVGFAIPFYKNISSRDAEGCVKKVMEYSSQSVIGNHDLYAIKKVPENNAGFEYASDWYSIDYEIRSRLSRNKIWIYEDNELPCVLSKESKNYLNSLKETDIVELPEFPVFISHFCYPDFTGSTIHFPDEGFHLKNHFIYTQSKKCVLSFSGHGHPEGCLIGTTEKIINLGFGTHNINYEEQWIVAPSIARTSRKNGLMIFDSHNLQLKIIPLTK